MRRRNLRSVHLPIVVAALTLLIGTSTAAPSSNAAPTDAAPDTGAASRGFPQRPNILLIVTDDQTVGSMQPMPKTRKWFGRDGLEFRQAFVGTPLCCPSRSSIFTGLYAHNHGVTRNADWQNLPIEKTMQSLLRNAGYRTAITGKYLNESIADPPKWDRWSVSKAGYFNTDFNLDGSTRTIPSYSTDFIAAKALEYLHNFEDNDAQPWFLYIAPQAPHLPARPHPRYAHAKVPPYLTDPARDEVDRSDKPPFVRSTRASEDRVRAFYKRQLRTLMSVDDLVGGVSSTLEDLGEGRNTLAIFMSDNGHLLGEHGKMAKRLPYTKSIRVPMFMRWPGHVLKGSVSQRFVMNVDVAPTILDAAGINPPHNPDGRSLLFGSQRDRILTEYFRDPTSSPGVPTWASTRTKSWQFTQYYDGDGEVTFEEYYNLKKDPYQLTNLMADGDPENDPDLTEERQTLDADRNCEGSGCP